MRNETLSRVSVCLSVCPTDSLLHDHAIRLLPQNTRARGGGTRSDKTLKNLYYGQTKQIKNFLHTYVRKYFSSR